MATKFDVKLFGKVAVLMGGRSAEREISLMSGKEVFESLKRSGVDAHAVDVNDESLKRLSQQNFDRAFNILHGRYGEDGAIQGFLETIHLPYTGSGIAASSLAMDKVRTKQIWQAVELPTLPFAIINKDSNHQEIIKNFGLPLCVKPVHEGSSNGVSRVNTIEELPAAFAAAKKFNDDVMVEPWIVGREFTVGLLDNIALPVIEIKPAAGFYDYHAKYFSNDTQYLCPCDLPKADEAYLKDVALKAFHVIGCYGWARIDFLQDKAGKFYLTEANTIPGMTTHSLVPKAARCFGIDFDELNLRILSKASRFGRDDEK